MLNYVTTNFLLRRNKETLNYMTTLKSPQPHTEKYIWVLKCTDEIVGCTEVHESPISRLPNLNRSNILPER